ncbi:MAG TPA: ABC transporter permease [Caulobacteraceae bacterium]|nr:ABC transporter permease [Caulobacteraceae bacterium]
MHAIPISPLDLAAAASLVLFDAVLSVALRLRLHRQVLIAAARMVVQLLAVGYLLRFLFALSNPWATLALVLAMGAIAAREITARSVRNFKDFTGLGLAATGVVIATVVTAGLALSTAIRPHPWYDPRYAISLVGIIMGSVLNAGSLTFDTMLGSLVRERTTIETRLALGHSFQHATAPLLRDGIRRGLLPVVNQMSAAGVITLPGIMTGQIIAGLDPVEAVKYQILLMFLLAGASGVASLVIGYGAMRLVTDERQRLRLDRLRERAAS